MKNLKGHIFKTFEYDDDNREDSPFFDREEEGHLRSATLEFRIDYTCSPGEPMVMYDRNGEGYPGSPPEVDYNATLIEVDERQPHPEEREIAEFWLNHQRLSGKIYGDIYAAVCEDADDRRDHRED